MIKANETTARLPNLVTRLQAQLPNLGTKLQAHSPNLATRLQAQSLKLATRLQAHSLNLATRLQAHSPNLATRLQAQSPIWLRGSRHTPPISRYSHSTGAQLPSLGMKLGKIILEHYSSLMSTTILKSHHMYAIHVIMHMFPQCTRDNLQPFL